MVSLFSLGMIPYRMHNWYIFALPYSPLGGFEPRSAKICLLPVLLRSVQTKNIHI